MTVRHITHYPTLPAVSVRGRVACRGSARLVSLITHLPTAGSAHQQGDGDQSDQRNESHTVHPSMPQSSSSSPPDRLLAHPSSMALSARAPVRSMSSRASTTRRATTSRPRVDVVAGGGEGRGAIAPHVYGPAGRLSSGWPNCTVTVSLARASSRRVRSLRGHTLENRVNNNRVWHPLVVRPPLVSKAIVTRCAIVRPAFGCGVTVRIAVGTVVP